MDAVAGSTCHIKGNHPLFAENGVHQRRLADIGAADDGEHRMFGSLRLFFGFGEMLEYVFNQVVNAIAVRTGNHMRLAQRQFEKFSGQYVAITALAFVHRQIYRARTLAQAVGNDFVLRGHTIAAIHQKHHGIGFIDGLQSVFGHFVQNAAVDHRLKTAGIHHQIRLAAEPAMAVMAIAGKAGQVGDQRVFGAGKAVE